MLTTLTVIFFVLAALIAVLCVLLGYIRGTGRSVVRLAYLAVIVLVSGLLSGVIAKAVSPALMDFIRTYYNKSITEILSYSPETEQLLQSILTTLMVPVVFSLLFLTLELLSLIQLKKLSIKIASLVRKDGDPMSKPSKLIGAGVGLLQGLLIAAVVLLPIGCGLTILSSADEASLAALNIQSSDGQAVSASYKADRYPVDVKYTFNAAIFKGMLSLESGVNLYDEAPVLIDAAASALSSYKNSGDNKTQAAFLAIGRLLPFMDNSKLLPELTSQLLRAAAGAWIDGHSFMDIKLDTTSSITGRLTLSFLETLRGATPKNIKGIIATLVGNGADSGVLDSIFKISDNNSDYKSKDSIDAMADMLVKIGKNGDMTEVITTVGELGTEIIKESGINVIEKDSPAYTEIKEELINAIEQGQDKPYEEQIAGLANSLSEIAGNNNAEVSDSEATILAVGLISYFGSTDEITEEGLMEYFGISDGTLTAG